MAHHFNIEMGDMNTNLSTTVRSQTKTETNADQQI